MNDKNSMTDVEWKQAFAWSVTGAVIGFFLGVMAAWIYLT